jgi:hypothetical protein
MYILDGLCGYKFFLLRNDIGGISRQKKLLCYSIIIKPLLLIAVTVVIDLTFQFCLRLKVLGAKGVLVISFQREHHCSLYG